MGSNLNLRSVQPRTLRQEVADILREAILLGKLEPGQRLVEVTLAQELGVGRVPIREALSQLEQQGLVTSLPNKGATVIQPSEEQIGEAVVLRLQLEVPATRLAATRGDPESLRRLAETVQQMAARPEAEHTTAEELYEQVFALDREFHQRLIEASGSTVFIQAWSTLSPYIWMIVVQGRLHRGQPWPPWSDVTEAAQDMVGDHEGILDALRSGDMERAERAVHVHCMVSLPKAGLDERLRSALHLPSSQWERSSSTRRHEDTRNPES